MLTSVSENDTAHFMARVVIVGIEDRRRNI